MKRLAFARDFRFGADFVPDGHVILRGNSNGIVLAEEAGLMKLTFTAPTVPLRRLRVAEFDLDPAIFPPEKTLFKRSGAWSPGDPSPTVPLSKTAPADDQAWRCRDVRKDGTIRYRSDLFAIFHSPMSGRTFITGFVTAFRQATRIHAEIPPDGKALRVRCVTYPHGAVPSIPKPVQSELLYVAEAATPEKALEGYLKLLYKNCGGIKARELTGWSDWQYYRRSKTEEHVTSNVDVLREQGYPVRVVMIDDGFQKSFGDWLDTNDKFKHDMRWVAQYIRDKGFEPGVWIAPFTVRLDSDLAKAHPDWLLKGRDGKLLSRTSHMGDVVALDMTHPEALVWLDRLVRTFVHDYGYKWVKLDGPIIRYIEAGAFYDRDATPVSMIRKSIEVIRKACGPDVVLEGEGYYGPCIGLVDTQRVTQDIQPTWPEMRNTTRDNLASTYWHGRFWANNPDAFILRDTPSPYCEPPQPERVLTRSEIELETTALALTGGVAMLTDRMDILKPERAALIDAFLPVHIEAAKPLAGDFMHSPYPERFVLTIRKPWSKWWIGACFNWDDKPRSFDYPMPGGVKKPVVVDFWKMKLLPVKGG